LVTQRRALHPVHRRWRWRADGAGRRPANHALPGPRAQVTDADRGHPASHGGALGYRLRWAA